MVADQLTSRRRGWLVPGCRPDRQLQRAQPLEKAPVGTRPGRAARAAALVVLAGMASLVGAAFLSPAAQARSQSVCCFRVTVEVTGEAHARYTRVHPTDDDGLYAYLWDGTAYGLAHLQ